ncbi:MAG: DUF2271 domain-containing protein [Acidimicrobiales bacterium]|nr:DUF2271 domain-containing protein [Acidimicrobiales bacterium]
MKNPRYPAVSRRALLKGSLGLGALALIPGLGCGDGDEAAFAGAAVDTSPSGDDTTTTTAPAEANATTSETSAVAETTESPTLGTALAAGAVMEISFTYQQANGGKNVPPYVAVWIEDTDGELVDTVALWFEQSQKGPRWLSDLRRWNVVDEDRIRAGGSDVVDVVSSATRLPGAYSLVWDGATIDGGPAPAGDYFICIEAVRERGPYSLVRQSVTLDGTPFLLPLADEGEVVTASATVA